MNFDETIIAPATGNASAAIAVLRVSGENAISATEKVFKTKKSLIKSNSHTLHFGKIMDGKEVVDEVLVSVFKNPNSYTGEDVVEISCHGSTYIQQRILQLFFKQGVRMAEPGEFTMRAFKNGKLDLAQAEAVADLIASHSKASHQVAMNQMRGGVSSQLKELREELIRFTALLELELDFSEEDVEFANRKDLEDLIEKIKAKIEELSKTFEYGNAIKNGVAVAIIGKPNAGKSTLLNVLLNEERAIVSDIAGTTRDTIEESVVLDGITFRFIDTAGIRKTEDEIEAIGVERAKEKVKNAKIVIHLYEEDLDILREIEPLLKDKIVFNLLSKIDKNDWADDRYEMYLFENYPEFHHFGISVKTGFNIELLKKELVESISTGIEEDATIITNLRHQTALLNALDSLNQVKTAMKNGLPGDLIAFDLRETLKHIGSITGDIDVDRDILGTIFGSFCIGK